MALLEAFLIFILWWHMIVDSRQLHLFVDAGKVSLFPPISDFQLI